MTIHTLHGIIDMVKGDDQVTRSFIEKNKFERYLRQLEFCYQPFQPVDDDRFVLTIDDATYAAAEACLIARHYNHCVHLFINPWQVKNHQNYYFSVLNAVIDSRRVEKINYNNLIYDLSVFRDIKKLRHHLKLKLMSLAESNALNFVSELAKQMHCPQINIEKCAQTLCEADLHYLKEKGVKIESHGWSHQSIDSVLDLAKDISDSYNWIYQNLQVIPLLYAVPFGKPDFPEIFLNIYDFYYLLSDDNIPYGRLSKKGWNRMDITNYINQTFDDNPSFYF